MEKQYYATVEFPDENGQLAFDTTSYYCLEEAIFNMQFESYNDISSPLYIMKGNDIIYSGDELKKIIRETPYSDEWLYVPYGERPWEKKEDNV